MSRLDSQDVTVAVWCGFCQNLNMAKYTIEALRKNLRVIVTQDPKLNVNAWTKRAKLSEGALRNFLNYPKGKKSTRSMSAENIGKLADAVGKPICELYGDNTHRPIKLSVIQEKDPVLADIVQMLIEKGLLTKKDFQKFTKTQVDRSTRRL